MSTEDQRMAIETAKQAIELLTLDLHSLDEYRQAFVAAVVGPESGDRAADQVRDWQSAVRLANGFYNVSTAAIEMIADRDNLSREDALRAVALNIEMRNKED